MPKTCSEPLHRLQLHGPTMATRWAVSCDVPPALDTNALCQALAEVLVRALEVCRLSDGAFDPAVGALVDAWGFGAARDTPRPSAPLAIANACRRRKPLSWTWSRDWRASRRHCSSICAASPRAMPWIVCVPCSPDTACATPWSHWTANCAPSAPKPAARPGLWRWRARVQARAQGLRWVAGTRQPEQVSTGPWEVIPNAAQTGMPGFGWQYFAETAAPRAVVISPR